MPSRRSFLASLVALCAPRPFPRPMAVDRVTGISIRFIRQWDPARDLMFNRLAFSIVMEGLPPHAKQIKG